MKIIKISLALLTGFLSNTYADIDSNTYKSLRKTLDSEFSPTSEIDPENWQSEKAGFVYFRFSTSQENLPEPTSAKTLSPGLGFGYRRMAGKGAVDISINGQGYNEERRNQTLFWTAPKALFIRYLTPELESSTYLACSLAWGGLKRARKEKNERVKFTGLIPSAVVGYEFFRKDSVLGFVEAEISRPSIPVRKEGELPGITAQVSLGAGF